MNLYPIIEKDEFNTFQEVKGGYINENGQWIIKAKYSQVGEFYDDIAMVSKDGIKFYINKKDEIIYSGKSVSHRDLFKNGIGIMTNDSGISTFIDNRGNEIFNLKLDSIREHFNKEDIATVVKNQKFGLLNKAGEFVVDPIYDYIGYYGEGLYPFRIGEKHGYMNIKGEIISELNCKFCVTFNNDRANIITDDD